MGNKGGKAKKGKKAMSYLNVLILGISGSGKSTFTKQMILIHQGFTRDEEERYKTILQQNILVGLQELVKQSEKLDLKVASENRKRARYFLELVVLEAAWDEKMAKKVKSLWNDPAIQQTWSRAPQFQMQMSNLEYLIQNIDRISSNQYIPSKDDILQARQRTTGQQTTTFTKDKYTWELIDVGGQKPERAKWEAIINGTSLHAIIYFAGLDEYNMTSVEEPGKTKMRVALDVFSEVLKTIETNQVCLLLFLNKVDLFRKKIQNESNFADFKRLFDYNGPQDVDKCCQVVQEKFLNIAGSQTAENVDVNTHIMCALDTDAIVAVFEAVKDDIFMKRIASSQANF